MKNNGYVWGALIAIVIIGAVVMLNAHKASAPGLDASSTGMGTTTVDIGNGESITLPPGATIHVENSTTTGSTANTVKLPSLTGALVISPSLDPAVQDSLRSKENATIAELKVSPTRLDLWLKLGVYRKIAGDYAGAAQAWQYVVDSGKSSVSYIAYGNLGELNLDFLKNYPKAESSYKAAISLNPNVIDYYRELYLMYISVYKVNTSAAADILAQGLKANPNNPDLLQLQAQLQGSVK